MNWKTATHQELYTVLQDNRAHVLDKQEAENEILRRCKPMWGKVNYKEKKVYLK